MPVGSTAPSTPMAGKGPYLRHPGQRWGQQYPPLRTYTMQAVTSSTGHVSWKLSVDSRQVGSFAWSSGSTGARRTHDLRRVLRLYTPSQHQPALGPGISIGSASASPRALPGTKRSRASIRYVQCLQRLSTIRHAQRTTGRRSPASGATLPGTLYRARRALHRLQDYGICSVRSMCCRPVPRVQDPKSPFSSRRKATIAAPISGAMERSAKYRLRGTLPNPMLKWLLYPAVGAEDSTYCRYQELLLLHPQRGDDCQRLFGQFFFLLAREWPSRRHLQPWRLWQTPCLAKLAISSLPKVPASTSRFISSASARRRPSSASVSRVGATRPSNAFIASRIPARPIS